MDTTASTVNLSPTPQPPLMEDWRLPGYCIPEKYNLTLIPNLETGSYKGIVHITFEAKEKLSLIKLHSQNLDYLVSDIKINQTPALVTTVKKHKETGFTAIYLQKELDYGKHTISIVFSGTMTNKIVGFYRSQYKNETGENRYIATSKLEPTYARQAFPCFDEPNYKAKYTVQIMKPVGDGYIALSNMDQIGEPVQQPDNLTELVSFNTSVPMSTYVTCFIVCDFKYTETFVKASHGDDVRLRVYATPAQQNKTKLALDVAKNVTAYYIDYFGIAYPLPKLDMIAIPDFSSGAMEHWGLVTYRETALLFARETSSTFNEQRVATVVAHELAHMWFGNLVTLDWWNDLWLNEGFATYMQFKATDHVLPEWGMMDQFLVSMLHSVLQFDASLSSHPIVQRVVTPDQITEIFDSISYNKGASILRMLENAIGEKKFQEGISNYLQKYKYSNAVTKNLWDEMQAIDPGFDISTVMDTWTNQMGFPIINVVKNGDTYTLTQARFLSNPGEDNPEKSSSVEYKWIIPVTYITDKGETGLKWFNTSSSELQINIPNAKWVKFNEKQIGYYRVNYPKEMWNNLGDNIKEMSISDRTHLLEESFSIAATGELSYDVPLSMTKVLENEDNYVVWSVASSKLKQLNTLLMQTDISAKYRSYVQSLVENIAEKLTWEEKETDTHLQRLARDTVMHLACTMGSQKYLDTAAELFKKMLNGGKLSQNTKGTVYYFGTQNSGAEEWDQLFEKYKEESDAQEKMKLLEGLAASRNQSVLSRMIKYANNETIVRSQDYFTCLSFISANPAGTSIVWDYVRENWEELVARFTLNDRYLGRLIPAITSRFTTKSKLMEMEDFFKRYPDAGAGATSRKQALEKVSNNIKWISSYQKQVEDWINANVNK